MLLLTTRIGDGFKSAVPYAGIIRIRFSGYNLRPRAPKGTVNHPEIGVFVKSPAIGPDLFDIRRNAGRPSRAV
jgi:hypothetical protein